MVQPVEHDFGSATGTTVLGAAKGALFYGVIGTTLATLAGAAIVGGIGFGAGYGVGALASAAGVAAEGAAMVVGSVIGSVGALVGGFSGFTYGGITSLAGGAIAGAFQGKNQVDREQSLAKSIQFEKSRGQEQMMAAVRGDAAEQYSAMGYMQGMQDGQAAVMNQLAAAQQQQHQQPAYENPESHVAKKIIHEHHAKHGAHPASHAEKAMNSKADNSQTLAV